MFVPFSLNYLFSLCKTYPPRVCRLRGTAACVNCRSGCVKFAGKLNTAGKCREEGMDGLVQRPKGRPQPPLRTRSTDPRPAPPCAFSHRLHDLTTLLLRPLLHAPLPCRRPRRPRSIIRCFSFIYPTGLASMRSSVTTLLAFRAAAIACLISAAAAYTSPPR